MLDGQPFTQVITPAGAALFLVQDGRRRFTAQLLQLVMQPAEQPWVILSQLGAIYYFAHFLVILPIVSRIERPLPMPNSITEAVLAKHATDTASASATA